MSSFNTTAFLGDAQVGHLKVGETLANADVRWRLDAFIDYKGSLFSRALDEICKNVVGNTMFRLLEAKKLPGTRFSIVDIGPEQARSKKPLIDQTGSQCFWHGIKINPNVYGKDGIGIPGRQYYCVDENGVIALKLKSIPASMFHEFVHCLHYTENPAMCEAYCDEKSLSVGDLWDSKEERRTISGYIKADAYEPVNTFDPICDNCYYLYDSIINGKRYMPRIGHCGYWSNDANQDEDCRKQLSAYLRTPESRAIIANYKKYMQE
jgi:hypothetical protein